MGLFGGGNSSSSNTQIDNRRTLDNGSTSAELQASGGSSVTYQSMDAIVAKNAIDAMQNTTSGAFDYGSGILSRVLTQSQQQTGAVLDSLQGTENMVSAAYADAKGRGALTDKILIGAIVGVVLIAFFALKK